MRLKKILEGVPHEMRGGGDPDIAGLSHDSRRIKPGDLFLAIQGAHDDGHDHAASAVKAGAAAVAAEKELRLPVPVALVPGLSRRISRMASQFYGRPSSGMKVAGVTGTNGKTTITYMLEAIFKAAGKKAGVMGTINYRWNGHLEKAPNTTPLASEVQRMLFQMKEGGVSHAAMEVSSHALALGRVEDVDLSCAIFTNLTRDHLDFHQTMENYFEAKAGIFKLLKTPPAAAVLNRDDPYFEKFKAKAGGKVFSYGINNASDFHGRGLSLTAQGTGFIVKVPSEERPFQLKTVGRHNVYNALAAIAAARQMEIPWETITLGLEQMPGVPGRLERVGPSGPGAFSVFVDYAHTDDALKNVLETLRPLTKKKLITVFGCGGDRDRTKRPLMGEAAVRMSDYVVITSDNPRSEDPQKIALDIEIGARRAAGARYETILDREEAIRRAIDLASPGDVLLIAGKGHETYQIFKDHTADFDDREVVRRRLEDLK